MPSSPGRLIAALFATASGLCRVRCLLAVCLVVGLAPSARADDRALCNAGRDERALAACTRTIESQDDAAPKAEAFNERGMAYERRGDRDKAIADFEKAVALEPGFAVAASNLAIAREALKQIEASPASAAADGPAPRRVALIIGNAAYSAAPPLPTPVKDADMIAASLRSAGFDDVRVLHDLDRAGMVAALRAFESKAEAADWAVIYFSGYGVALADRSQIADDAHYTVPVDAQLAAVVDIEDEAIPLERLQRAIDGARKFKMIVFDACRKNPFPGSVPVEEPRRAINKVFGRALPQDETLFVLSARASGPALDGDKDTSPFARAFARRLAEPGLDIRSAVGFVRDDVKAETGGKQEPLAYGTVRAGPVVFMRR